MDFSLINDFKNDKIKHTGNSGNTEESHYQILISKLNDLKKELDSLKKTVCKLEDNNKFLIKHKNKLLIREYGHLIVDLIKEDKFEEFKALILEEDYPINEYIVQHKHYKNMNLLHFCLDLNKNTFSEFLINYKADINAPDGNDKWTPIMYTIQKKNFPLSKLLLEKGANVDYKDTDGFSPLAVAVDSRNIEFIKLIIKYKPQIDVKMY
jgi:ankyrin repeat protein